MAALDEHEPEQPRRAPGAQWYLVAIVLIVAGPLALVGSSWYGSRPVRGVAQRCAAPGVTSVLIARPGEYALRAAQREGSAAEIPEDLRLTIIEPTRGAEFDLEPTPGEVVQAQGESWLEIARVTLDRPGPYQVAIEGSMAPTQFEIVPAQGPGIKGGGLATPSLLRDAATGARTLGALLFGSLSIIGFMVGVAILIGVWIARGRAGNPDQSQV